MDRQSADLIVQWHDGDQGAARELFERYAGQLIALARKRLSARIARHIDAEDVIQSAYRSFFVGAREGKYVLRRSGDLWRLLVGITIHKLKHQFERFSAHKRSVTRECSPVQELSRHETTLAREPTPVDAAALTDTLQHILQPLDMRQRRMVELRLQGYSLAEIASAVERSERTVRRVLEQIKERLEQENSPWSPA